MREPARPRLPSRQMAVASMRARLLRQGFPRIQMFVLVSLTALAGFGASVAMLAAGIESMALRYLLAMGVAYIVFLLLLWLWLRASALDYVDAALTGAGDGGAAGVPAEAGNAFAGAGGSFDGGGASAHVEFALDGKASALERVADKPLGVLKEADEAAIPLAVLLLALGIALSSLFVIWSAPILFAEILVDALLAAGLYRRLRVLDPRHWMVAALRRTLVPFILTTLFVAGAGWAMQAHAPGTRSLGEVLASR